MTESILLMQARQIEKNALLHHGDEPYAMEPAKGANWIEDHQLSLDLLRTASMDGMDERAGRLSPPPRRALSRRGSGWWKRRSLRRKQETSPMAKLTDAQLIILSAAAQREDGAALPLAKSLKLRGAAATRVLGALLKAKLLAERPATLEAEAWRTAKNGRRFALAITDAGRQAIGMEAPEAEATHVAQAPKQPRRRAGAPKAAAAEAPPASEAARPASKQAQVIALLRRPEGATVEALMAATGWQRHTVRGAISGALKKKLGLAVAAEKVEGRGQVYRIAAA